MRDVRWHFYFHLLRFNPTLQSSHTYDFPFSGITVLQSVEAFSCTVAFPPIIGQHVRWRHKSVLIHSSSVPSFSCTQGHKGCWSLSQLSAGRGTVTPWVSWQFIAGLPRKTNNHSHSHSRSQFRVSNSAHVHGWTAGGNRSTLTRSHTRYLFKQEMHILKIPVSMPPRP